MELTAEELELVRQWFDAVQDLNPHYLEQPDYGLARKIYERLEIRVPSSILTPKNEDAKYPNEVPCAGCKKIIPYVLPYLPTESLCDECGNLASEQLGVTTP